MWNDPSDWVERHRWWLTPAGALVAVGVAVVVLRVVTEMAGEILDSVVEGLIEVAGEPEAVPPVGPVFERVKD